MSGAMPAEWEASCRLRDNVVTNEEQPYTQNQMILPVFESRIPVTATHLNAYKAAPRLLFYFSNVIEREYSRPQWCAIHPRGSWPGIGYLSFNSSLSLIPPSPA